MVRMNIQLPKDTLRAIRCILLADEKLTMEQAEQIYKVTESAYLCFVVSK